jgi:hypothetical protein
MHVQCILEEDSPNDDQSAVRQEAHSAIRLPQHSRRIRRNMNRNLRGQRWTSCSKAWLGAHEREIGLKWLLPRLIPRLSECCVRAGIMI